MMNLSKKIGIVFCFLFAVTLFVGCGGVSGKTFDRYGYFGTLTVFAVYADFSDEEESKKTEDAIAECEAALEEIDKAIGSAQTSDISRFNAAACGETLEISRITYELLGIAKDMYGLTNGAYNPAVGNLVDLWGFSPRFESGDYAPTEPYDRETPSQPEEKYIEAFLSPALLDFGKVKLSENEDGCFVTKPNGCVEIEGEIYTVNLNLGGIGKGYAADKCAEILSKRGVKKSYVGVGQSSLSLLEGNEYWRVTLNHPRGRGKYLTVSAANVAASTSGDYERFFIENGKRYCHIIDPKTGRPTSGTAAVSMFGMTAAEGDALTTALMCMSTEEAAKFIREKTSGVKVFMLDEETLTLRTNADKSDYELGDGTITVLNI